MQHAATERTGISSENDNIFRTLEELYRTARLMLGKSTVTLEDTRLLAGYVTQVRALLAELELIEIRSSRLLSAPSPVTGLKERYLELEGMVKEVRNSLHRKSQASLGAF
jgi:hypothetical protein